uniref:Clip domain-containing protein n=1 Tax=Steinernema glaseri TaxID=37863 RepID=A0A1I7Z5Q0_9BILA
MYRLLLKLYLAYRKERRNGVCELAGPLASLRSLTPLRPSGYPCGAIIKTCRREGQDFLVDSFVRTDDATWNDQVSTDFNCYVEGWLCPSPFRAPLAQPAER